MEVLSPRSTNVRPAKKTTIMKTKPAPEPKPIPKPTNPDRIEDEWRPPSSVTEPGQEPEIYMTGRKLGKGGFAVCFEGQSTKTNKIFALKVVKAKVEQKKMMEKFRTELQIHAKMNHPNIVDFLRAFTLENHTYVVLELCSNGNLTDMVRARSCLSLPEVRRFLVQICGGVRYMHKRSVIHRDLKMGNIFLDSNMNIKIGDFGLAAVMADEQDRRTTLCGTPNYIAPEILSKSGARGHDNKVDTWAIGVIAYAMLVGTPPFQSKTQQEIYTKLRSLEYEWKIDSKNFIPQQAKNFVASCLNLTSAERPEMDDLVEHDFFTMGVVADTLNVAFLKHKPEWLLNADPRGDKVENGYGVSHSQICRAAGVGRRADGSSRAGVGGKHFMSTLVEIEVENQSGSAPTVPLPEGILYSAISEAQAEQARQQQHSSLPTRVRGKKPLLEEMERIPEESNISSKPATTTLPVRSYTGVPSFAATQRRQAVSKPRMPLTTLETEQPAAEQSQPGSEGFLRARPVRAASVRATRSTTTSQSQVSRTLPKSTTMRSTLDVGGIIQQPTSRTTTMSQGVRDNRPPSRSLKLASMGDNATIRPASVMSRSSDDASQGLVTSTTVGGQRNVDDTATSTARVPVNPALVRRSVKRPLISSSDPYTYIDNTSSAKVVSSLQDLHDALNPRRSKDLSSASGSRRLKARLPHPRVDKWVDYSGRHGMSYLLTDGTMGMIKKQSDPAESGGCIVIRNAKGHAVKRARGLTSQLVPHGRRARAVEFYVQSQDNIQKLEVPSRNFLLDAQKHNTQTEAIAEAQKGLQSSELERFKEISLLDKLGRYMNKREVEDGVPVEEDESILPKHSDHFIHFYQKIGNVTVWRFANGGMQFNFPDHTKLIVYQDTGSRSGEYCIDMIYLEPKDATDIAKYGRLTRDALERRDQMTVSLVDVMSGSLRSNEAEIVQSNEIREKLQWIRAVLSIWIREGGVGFMGEEKLGWSGLQEKREDKKTCMQWVTVGKLGGDV